MMVEKALWTENFRPCPGECVASIAVRLAPHGLLTPQELVRKALKYPTLPLALLPARNGPIERLARLTGLQAEELARNGWIQTLAGYRMLGREVPADWVETGSCRFAPGVLARDGGEPHIRTLWQIAALACDPDSGEALRSRCWKCGSAMTWQTRLTVCECDCGADQRAAPIRLVPQDVALASRELATFFDYESRPLVPVSFDSLPEPALFSLLGWFGYFSDLREGARLRPSAVNAAKGYQALKRWPASFDEVLISTLRDFVEQAESASRSLRIWTMAQLMTVIDRAGSPEAIAILRARAEHVLGVSCDTKLVLERVLGAAHRREWPVVRQLALGSGAMRLSHDRINSRARWSS
jgi:TniQ